MSFANLWPETSASVVFMEELTLSYKSLEYSASFPHLLLPSLFFFFFWWQNSQQLHVRPSLFQACLSSPCTSVAGVLVNQVWLTVWSHWRAGRNQEHVLRETAALEGTLAMGELLWRMLEGGSGFPGKFWGHAAWVDRFQKCFQKMFLCNFLLPVCFSLVNFLLRLPQMQTPLLLLNFSFNTCNCKWPVVDFLFLKRCLMHTNWTHAEKVVCTVHTRGCFICTLLCGVWILKMVSPPGFSPGICRINVVWNVDRLFVDLYLQHTLDVAETVIAGKGVTFRPGWIE